jgi:hypothetical protein
LFGGTRNLRPVEKMAQDNTKHFSAQSKKRGTPAFAGGQRETILRLLREAKLRGDGVSNNDLRFQYRYSDAPTRIFELKAMGWGIESRWLPGQRYISYFLLSEPEHIKPLPTYLPKGPDPRQHEFSDSEDWYTRETGKPRPAEQPPDLGPLFAGVRP